MRLDFMEGDKDFYFKDPPKIIIPGAVWVPLTHSMHSLIDEQDYDLVTPWQWKYTKGKSHHMTGYAHVWMKTTMVLLHRVIMSAPKGTCIDHKNTNGLDNRRCNLRYATLSQNMGNTRKTKVNTSGYKGVFWDKTKNRWLAQLHLKSGSVYLGRYLTKEEAARAYDKGALQHFGEFALLNFREGT